MIKKVVFACLGLLFIGVSLYAGDDSLSRPDIYGTPPARWNYTHVTTTTTVKSTGGLISTIAINKVLCTGPIGIIVYDNTTATGSIFADYGVTNSTQTYNYGGANTATGITIGVPATCTTSITVSYR